MSTWFPNRRRDWWRPLFAFLIFAVSVFVGYFSVSRFLMLAIHSQANEQAVRDLRAEISKLQQADVALAAHQSLTACKCESEVWWRNRDAE